MDLAMILALPSRNTFDPSHADQALADIRLLMAQLRLFLG